MSCIRSFLGGLATVALLLGLFSVAGCGEPEAGSAPKMKGSKDEIQKGMAPPLPAKKK